MTLELSKQQRADATASIRRYFDENMSEPIGELAAGQLLNYFLEEIAPLVYNNAIGEAQGRMAARVADLDSELFADAMQYWPRQEARRRKAR